MKLEPLGYIGKESVEALQGGESQVTGTICNPRHFSDDVALYTIPEGYVVVPVEPTPRMLEAVGMMRNYDLYAAGSSPDADHVEWYKAMLTAAKEQS